MRLDSNIFRTRLTEKLHVNNFQPAQFDQSMIDSLVTKDQSRVDFLKALAKSFARENSAGDRIVKDPWSADYVAGKGNGLIFLLHGKPGVGKTYTAGKFFHNETFIQKPGSITQE